MMYEGKETATQQDFKDAMKYSGWLAHRAGIYALLMVVEQVQTPNIIAEFAAFGFVYEFTPTSLAADIASVKHEIAQRDVDMLPYKEAYDFIQSIFFHAQNV